MTGVTRAFFDHTGDVGVSLSAATLPELFGEAALAFTETVTDLTRVRYQSSHPVTITAATLDDLMVEWLGELLYRFEVQNLLVAVADLEVRETGAAWTLAGFVRGEPFDPARHEIRVLVKGVTYHRLGISQADGRWTTDVVLDI